MKGKYKKIKWVADIKEYDPRKGWNIWINFLCPEHNVYLGRKDAEVPECNYGVLWCRQCDKQYPFKEGDFDDRSDCHAWSSSPLYHLMSLTGGIYPASPGFKNIRIQPELG